MGSRAWERKKAEIEAVVQQHNPDIFIISELNMKACLTDAEKNIAGYNMIIPRTVEARRLVRIVMLVKSDMEVKVLKEYMDTDVAAIWVKIGARGRKPMVLGGVYREFQYLEQGQPNPSSSDRQQVVRWFKFIYA